MVHGYLWDKGRFTTIDGPDGTGASATDVNDRGEIIGVYARFHGPRDHRRLSAEQAASTPRSMPLVPRSPSLSASTTGARSSVSATTDPATGADGFLLRQGRRGPLHPDRLPDAPVTGATDIDDHGRIVGFYANPDAAPDRQPSPMPMPMMMSGLLTAAKPVPEGPAQGRRSAWLWLEDTNLRGRLPGRRRHRVDDTRDGHGRDFGTEPRRGAISGAEHARPQLSRPPQPAHSVPRVSAEPWSLHRVRGRRRRYADLPRRHQPSRPDRRLPRRCQRTARLPAAEGWQVQQDRLPGRPRNRGLEDQQPRSDRGRLQ